MTEPTPPYHAVVPPSPPTTARRPVVAVVCNSLPPYRVHVHRRIARELTEIELWTLCTHQSSIRSWADAPPPPEIKPVLFGPGEASDVQADPGRAPAEWRKGGRVIRWLEEHGARAVVMLGYNDAGRLRVIRWCRRAGVPCLLWGDSNIRGERDAPAAWRWLKRRVVSFVVRNCAAVLPCGSLGRAYFRQYGARDDRMFYFPVEPDYALIHCLPLEEIDAARQRRGLALDRRRMVFSGRLAPEKRPDLLLAAFLDLARQVDRQEWDLVLLGDGPLRAELEARVPAELAGRVRWTGFVADPREVAAVYRAGDVLVLPSDYEPWALVVNEAAAAGLAIVCSDAVGAAAELVRDGVNGTVFPAGDVTALARALREVTAPDRIDALKAGSATVLADWRRAADPIAGLRRALVAVGLLPPGGVPGPTRDGVHPHSGIRTIPPR
jgi:glycosyltransferase involved in cell wall biosynthesis